MRKKKTASSNATSRRRRFNPFKLNPRRLLAFGALVFATGGGLFTWHHFAPQETRDQIESVTLNVLDLVRESELAPAELVFWLDLVADNIPLTRGNVVAPGIKLAGTGHSLGGLPAAAQPLTALRNTGYFAGYDERRKNPAWVAYKVFQPRHPPSPRPEGFESDERTTARIESALYAHSGFDRGHLAPNRAIALCYGREAQRETFRMSNVVPQKHGLNAGFWEAMERRIMDRYTRRYENVWVLCGPIYDTAKAPRLIRGKIAVPDAFYLIIAEQSSGGIRAQAFNIPHQAIKKNADPTPYLTSIRDIERRTGLDFFPDLPGPNQDALETHPSKRAW
ncbi:MAG: DNA/RNA non-specific endonuclease [Puniceicoccales bacterium]|jgi:endonuclease G|nr:DNA/RNA non-specific endonuclease [Puniceicoccales bacterium]